MPFKKIFNNFEPRVHVRDVFWREELSKGQARGWISLPFLTITLVEESVGSYWQSKPRLVQSEHFGRTPLPFKPLSQYEACARSDD